MSAQLTESCRPGWLKDFPMMLTGTINRVRRGTFCWIRTPDGIDFWAHKNEFADASLMKEEQIVRFTPVENLIDPSQGPKAMNVMAA